jgi:hypothetical protein
MPPQSVPWTYTPPRTSQANYSRVVLPVDGTTAEIHKESKVAGPVGSSKQGPAVMAVDHGGPRTNQTKQYKFSNDPLGKLVHSSIKRFLASSSWAAYVSSTRGQSKPPFPTTSRSSIIPPKSCS